ncbi:phage tail protein [Stenotrophomonas sp.]|uniref:phage tail protein n=1 Tax=Stenotrophomonas sp. TaxID=69392 RepID=UPI0028AAEC7D|nr:phage tail protein [Stenotrophomonas sp.]
MADQNSQYMAILTAAGEAKDANAKALGVPWTITHMGIGDGNGAEPMPSRTQTALINERRRAPLNQLSVDPNNEAILIAEQVIPEDVGGWWIREIGLYDEAGVLVAVANCPPTYKPELAQGSGRTQVVRLNLITSSTQNIQLKIDPSVVLATRAYADSLIVGHLAAVDPHKQYKLRGGFTSLNANTLLTAAHEGVVVLDATGADRTLTLPVNDAAFGVRDLLIRRLDNSGNRARVQVSGTDKIKFHTHLNAAGYAFLYLMGAGDWWHLRSDGAGGWWPIGRHDSDAIGRPVLETTTAVSPGGWGVFAGSVFNRADWPWLWDHAQQSGMLSTEAARVGMEGGWTSGDGALTFRGPDGRGEFLRVLDDGYGRDSGRVAGSNQLSENKAHSHSVYVAQVNQTVNAGSGLSVRAASSGETGSSGGHESRPVNIAYPGRIKLI